MANKLLALLSIGAIACFAAAQGPPGGPPPFEQPGMPGPVQPRPELATKMMQILALRELLQAGITTKDIKAALPTLRDLLAKERAMQKESDAVLAQVREELLRAQPGDTDIPDGADQLRAVVTKFRASEQQAWTAVAKALGKEKAVRLRGLLGGLPMRPGPGGPGTLPPGPEEGMQGGPGDGGPRERRGPDGRGRPGDRGPGRGVEPGGPDSRPLDGMEPRGMQGGRPRLTLAELVGLLEQKLVSAGK